MNQLTTSLIPKILIRIRFKYTIGSFDTFNLCLRNQNTGITMCNCARNMFR